MTTKELIEAINSAKLLAPNYLEDEFPDVEFEKVAELNYDEHRWYVVATVVFKVGDDFIGVNGPISLKSEQMGFDDVGLECIAFEMEAVPSVTYREKR